MSNRIRKLLLGLQHSLKTHNYIWITKNHLPLGLRIHAKICHSCFSPKNTLWGVGFNFFNVQKMGGYFLLFLIFLLPRASFSVPARTPLPE
jgi:hypothetical protein